MYCSNSDDGEHCTNPDNWIRTGIPFTDGKTKYYLLGLEELFYREGVDIVFAAHEHSYERCYPAYKLKVSCQLSDTVTAFNLPITRKKWKEKPKISMYF